jgi:hypothetical protein
MGQAAIREPVLPHIDVSPFLDGETETGNAVIE